MSTAIVNKIIPFSSVDGRGNRSAIFLQGCNYNCLYCHNPETIKRCISCKECIEKCKTGALFYDSLTNTVRWDDTKCVGCDDCIKTCKHSSSPKTKIMSASDVIERVKKQMPYIRGITVSGGECTLQSEFLRELFFLAKKLSLSTFLDSNGTYNFSSDPELLSVTDGVMLDIKAFDNEEHIAITSANNEIVLKNAVFLAEHHKLEEVRTVVVPGLFNAENTVTNVCKLLHKYSNEVTYKLIKYRPFGVREKYKEVFITPSDDLMNKLERIAAGEGFKTIISGNIE